MENINSSSCDVTPGLVVDETIRHRRKLTFYFVVEKRTDFGELRIILVRQCNTLHARAALISSFT